MTQTLTTFRERVYHGTWGMAPFQSVYQKAPNTLWSLPLMPEWYLVIILFLMLSGFGIFWKPLLLVGSSLLFISVCAVIAQAIMSAARASFVDLPKTKEEYLKSYAVTAFLHLLQPLARLKGRLKHGLTPWRRRGTPKGAFPVPQTKELWSEKWYPIEKMLENVRNSLEEDGAIVQCGGEFDRWDLEVRGGIMGSARILATVEEHGAGKQYFRFKITPKISFRWFLVVLLISGIALLSGLEALLNGGLVVIAFTCLTLLNFLLLYVMYRECAAPFASIFDSLESMENKLRNEAFLVEETHSEACDTEENIPSSREDFSNQGVLVEQPELLFNKRATAAASGKRIKTGSIFFKGNDRGE